MISKQSYKEIETIESYLQSVPYEVSRTKLYSASELYEGYDYKDDNTLSSCRDFQVYNHYIKLGKHANNPMEALARSLHDYSIGVALDKFLATHDPKLTIGIMGGHAVLRTDPMYERVALLTKQLTEMGFLLLSGGGPGAMEATHLGAWMSGRTNSEMSDALSIMASAPTFRDKNWLKTAFSVIEKYPQTRYESLAIPTWLYGHEPSTPFATHIAKYFENSLREDNILTYAFGGIVYTPGSAGTVQEIFQDAVQNHYLSFGFASPMVFMGRKFWTENLPVYSFLQKMQESGRYKNLILSIHDKPEDIINELLKFRKNNKR